MKPMDHDIGPGSIPPHVPEPSVYDFDIFNPAKGDGDYFEAIYQLHQRGLPEIFWTPRTGGHWVALKGDVITAIFRDTATFSSVRMLVPDEANFAAKNLFLPLMSDPPDHGAYRSIVMSLFAPSRMNKLEEEIRAFTIERTAALRKTGHCEFISEFALQVPIMMILKLLALPQEDRLPLLDLAARIVLPSNEKASALQVVVDYLKPIIAERCARPGTDIFSELAQAKIDGRSLTQAELLGMASTILIGGLDSVAATLGFFVNFLATNPDIRQQLIDQPDLIKKAVEELLRRFPTTTHSRRITRDCEFRSVPMKSGQRIVWGASMYNFDDRIFPDPMSVKFDRPRTSFHQSFGSGIHACLGAALARIELRVFLEEWLKAIPRFSIEPGATVLYRPGINVGLQSIPLVWST